MASFYQINNSFKEKFASLDQIGDWYQEMSECNLDQSYQIDLEDSWPIWQLAASTSEKPLFYLFAGDISPVLYDSGDPLVGFISYDIVKELAEMFKNHDQQYFYDLLASTGFSADDEIYLYDLFKEFFVKSAQENKAILFLLS